MKTQTEMFYASHKFAMLEILNNKVEELTGDYHFINLGFINEDNYEASYESLRLAYNKALKTKNN